MARDTARLLDEIDETGNAVAVVRFGRIVAVLAPFENGEDDWRPPGQLDSSAGHIDDFALGSIDRGVFELIVREPTGVTRLELAGLIEKGLGRFRLTKLGRSVRR